MDGIRYIDEVAVAEITGFSLSKLRNDRCRGTGIPYLKPGAGRLVKYKLADVLEYMEAGRISTENG